MNELESISQSSKSWPFIEALKADIKNIRSSKKDKHSKIFFSSSEKN